ncbi:MAG TPA: response regulator [Polyangiaceae bacterium]
MLIVDDDADIRSMYAWRLRASGWIVAEIEDGAEAVDAVHWFRPDAVVMDIRLPHVDGLEVARRIKADPQLAGVPILVCTGALDGELEAEAKESGCDAFVRKPCLPDDLREALEDLVRSRT